jgi:threonine synthase
MCVTDDEILEAQRVLASRDGIFAEPASCTTIASLFKLKKEGKLPQGIKAVCVLTGNGLKDPDAALLGAPEPIEIDDSWESLVEVLRK